MYVSHRIIRRLVLLGCNKAISLWERKIVKNSGTLIAVSNISRHNVTPFFNKASNYTIKLYDKIIIKFYIIILINLLQ